MSLLEYLDLKPAALKICSSIFNTSVFGIEKNLERCSDVLGHLLKLHGLCFSYMYLSMMDLKLTSININGLRSNLKQSSVKDIILQNKSDILLLQETFDDNSFLAKSIEQNLGLDMRCIWNFSKGNSWGVAIFFLNNNISIEKFHCDFLAELYAWIFRWIILQILEILMHISLLNLGTEKNLLTVILNT